MRTGSPRSASASYVSHGISSGEAGFTLIELMVVILIISVVAVLAIPSLSQGGYDRRVFTDAATIGEIVREARTRSVGRGAAELLAMVANPGSNSASFTLYESVSANPSGAGGTNIPVSTCNSPTVWPGAGGTATANLVDEYQFTGGNTLEGEAGMIARIILPTGTAVPSGVTAYLCFTPNGRVQYQMTTPLAGSFSAISGTVGAVVVELTRGSFAGSFGSSANASELVRQVWIPPSGATRITSF